MGLSGGVDSAVSAALLQKAGYDVTGVFIKVWQPDWLECNWKEERREAMRVAAHLGIPFITLDLEKEYKEGVIDYMLAEYKAGRTPNPDVMCNREVKFGAFWRWTKSQGADYIATGHYARIKYRNIDDADLYLREAFSPRKLGEKGSLRHASASVNVIYQLFAGRDKNKDQSYFLWTLNQDNLAHTLFPVGHLEKTEVRKLAHKFKLPNADKKDSQGLCFIGKVDVKDFLAHYLKAEPGNVLNEEGEIIGKHQGALFFTIGERHGFTITKKTPDDDRYYVIDKDMEQNTITVSNRIVGKDYSSSQKTIRISNINWIAGTAPIDNSIAPPLGRQESLEEERSDERGRAPAARSGGANDSSSLVNTLHARSRYRQPLQNIKIHSVNMFETIVEFKKPQDALTPGQSLVIYNGEECVGGGIIVE